MKHAHLLLITLALMLVRLGSVQATESASKPNIIFLLADDSGFADFGCYGHPYAKTPNIDRLAADGTRFTQFYATGVTCCPTRTGLMTSRWPASYPTYPANGGFADRVTITDLLHQQGYATGHFGKWHIGPEDQAKPGRYGIDVISAASGAAKKKNTAGRDAPIYDEAIKLIEQHQGGPFYINVWGHVSHHKVDPPQSYIDKFKDLTVDESKFAEPMQEKFAACKALGGAVSDHMRAYLADIHPTRRNGSELALYDIVNDPGEKQNLVSRHPEIVKKLSTQIDAWVGTLPQEYVKTDDKDK